MLRLLSPLTTLVALSLLVPVIPGVAAAQQGTFVSLDRDAGASAAELGGPAGEQFVDEAQDEAYDEYLDEYGEEEEFCGDGDSGPLDAAYEAFYEEDYEGARAILAAALRDGALNYDREMYLILLGDAQLRLNAIRPATVNYRRAIAAAPEYADRNGARLGLAISLSRNGQRSRAQDQANAILDATCSDDERATTTCYVAAVVAAETARDEETREKSQHRARELRTLLREYELEAVAYYDTLFGVERWPAGDGEDAAPEQGAVEVSENRDEGPVGGADAHGVDAGEESAPVSEDV